MEALMVAEIGLGEGGRLPVEKKAETLLRRKKMPFFSHCAACLKLL